MNKILIKKGLLEASWGFLGLLEAFWGLAFLGPILIK
jgi:hypothetical protein